MPVPLFSKKISESGEWGVWDSGKLLPVRVFFFHMEERLDLAAVCDFMRALSQISTEGVSPA